MSTRSQRFVPKKGSSENLQSLPKEKGSFIVTLDNRRIYLDAEIDNELQRIPLGGDFSMADIPWSVIIDKPFYAVSADFEVVTSNINDENVDTLFLADNLRITNKTVLDKFSESENNDLLYNGTPIGLTTGTVIYKDRVDSFLELEQIENPQCGWLYNVGESDAIAFDKFVYVTDGDNGNWQPIYSLPNYNNLVNKPTINGVEINGNLSLSDLGIVSGGYTTKGSVLFANLPSSITSPMVGWVYNISDNFTTNNNFVEGSGISYAAGTNVVIVRTEDAISYSEATLEEGANPAELGLYEENNGVYILTEDTSAVGGKTYYTQIATPTYKFDVLGGFVDVSPIDTRVTATQGMLAPAFNSTENYSVGDFVTYDNKFYICTTAHSGTWAAADFSETNIAVEMNNSGDLTNYYTKAEADSIFVSKIDDIDIRTSPTTAEINASIAAIWA